MIDGSNRYLADFPTGPHYPSQGGSMEIAGGRDVTGDVLLLD